MVASSQLTAKRPRAIANWLLVVAGMVVLILVVGGITRLTESGLSITQWNPVTGALPPLTDAQWQAEYARYRATPEFRFEAGPAGMTLEHFKFIFFWEWFHRLIGRLIGLAFALPLAWFWVKGQIPTGYKPRLVALLALGGLQGTFGWLMVRSGLSGQMTDVSHFWLSIHLTTALFTLAGLVWTALDLIALHRHPASRPRHLRLDALLLGAMLLVQLVLGAWVAGLNAGHVTRSWPLMDGRLVPEVDSGGHGTLYTLTHDPFLLHFLHRWWAIAVLMAMIWFARSIRGFARLPAAALNGVVGTQVVLGILTVVSGVSLWIAVLHQLVGALLVATFAWAAHAKGRERWLR
ncbi:COX15/CtaA family protein [Erythrobacter sp. LQ02-29]|uniref:COX15/CtaA family protein n=1 Tax=Erythrobacter sp. LQ02-29 TaxID=2920384 RepID=UPI001F4DAFE7|nr:COX15/CtaA family protein [Erythrobacter sp. LQ02-29]MCP9221869.1 COX15/CtaA family protein [Erythrobacter sp. LQ02-29]